MENPGAQEVLNEMYARHEEHPLSYYHILSMIRAELALGLNEPIQTS